MKLTNQQIDVLVDEVYEKTKKSKVKKVNEEVTAKAIDIIKELKALSPQTKKYLKDSYYDGIPTFKEVYEHFEDEEEDNEYDQKRKIKSKVILASIDAADLAELQKKLNVKL